MCMRPVSLQSPRGILEFPDQDFGGPPDGEQLARLPRSLVRQSAQVVASATADTTVLYKEALIQRLSAAGHVTVVSVDLLMQVFAGLQKCLQDCWWICEYGANMPCWWCSRVRRRLHGGVSSNWRPE